MEGRRESDNVEDVRGMGGGRGLMIGGGGGIVTLIIIVLAVVFNQDPQQLLQNLPQDDGMVAVAPGEGIDPANDPQAELKRFASQVLADTEDTWTDLLPRYTRKQYQPPKLRLFKGYIESACGGASSAVGPFYCPGDQKVYLDLGFFQEMKDKFGAPGDFAMAYVIAHEVGHHIQDQLGLSSQVQQAMQQLKQQGREAEANQYSVRLELQADFLAGVWAHHAEKRQPFLERGDVAEAVNAAEQIGDDTLQRRASGRVVKDAFTHGTSKQRARWFKAGIDSGNFDDLNQLFELPYEEL
jgi:predicted metalloprotease